MSAQQGQDWLDFSKQQYQESQPRQQAMDDLSMQVARQGLSASQFQDQVARDQYAQYQKLGVPAIEKMYNDAQNYGSAENQEIAAQGAGTDVAQQVSLANDANSRSMMRMGVNPNSGAFASINSDQALQGAVAQAGAETAARKNVRDQGIMLTKDAAGFASGQPGTAAQTFSSSVNSGMGGVQAVGAAGGLAAQRQSAMAQGFQGAMSGYGQSANILNADYSNRLKSYQIQTGNDQANTSGWLGAAGTAVGVIGAVAL